MAVPPPRDMSHRLQTYVNGLWKKHLSESPFTQ